MDSENRVLSVKNLSLKNREGKTLVHNFSLELGRGDTLGLVGESGSGKTLSMRSISSLLPEGISEEYEEKQVRGNCAMIFQNPMSALDPLCPVVSQLTEIVMLHRKVKKKQAREIAAELFRRLSLPEDLLIHDRYPFELSGGQCQRVLIAIALSCEPDLLLCDEPTTALDVTVQKQTLDLIRTLKEEENFAVLFVTHNLAVAASVCTSIAVMQKGQIVEQGKTDQILHAPTHPYTRMLLDSILEVPAQEIYSPQGKGSNGA